MTVRAIRSLDAVEIETLVGWAAGEGWNPGLADAHAFQAADPAGFLGVFVGKDLVAGISALAYGGDFGFVGLYICHPAHRGRGHGKAVWDAGLSRLAGRTVGLDGVEAQQANYCSMGFVPRYRTVRWSGLAPAERRSAGSIVQVTPGMLPELGHFDRRFFPGPRTAFLEAWTSPPRLALAIIDGGQIRGFGVARRCGDGVKIGPLYTEATDVAKALLTGLAARLPKATVLHIDVPEPSATFTQWLQRHGFAKGFETMRMYRGPAPAMEQVGVFGVSTLELG